MLPAAAQRLSGDWGKKGRISDGAIVLPAEKSEQLKARARTRAGAYAQPACQAGDALKRVACQAGDDLKHCLDP